MDARRWRGKGRLIALRGSRGAPSARSFGDHDAFPAPCRIFGLFRRWSRPLLFRKSREARNATAKLANQDRDEDRGGAVGFESKAERIRQFAAAEGAGGAYKRITGEDWKAYQAAPQGPAPVERRSANAELSAFEG